MDIRIQCIAVDASDCELLARFWSSVLGWRITYESDAEWCLEPPEGDPANDVADVRWVVLADPEGNEFCVLPPLPPESD